MYYVYCVHKKYVSPVTALCVCKETYSVSVECWVFVVVVVDVLDVFFLFFLFFFFALFFLILCK